MCKQKPGILSFVLMSRCSCHAVFGFSFLVASLVILVISVGMFLLLVFLLPVWLFWLSVLGLVFVVFLLASDFLLWVLGFVSLWLGWEKSFLTSSASLYLLWESQYFGQHFTTQLALKIIYIYKKWVLIVMVGYQAVGGTFNHGLFL